MVKPRLQGLVVSSSVEISLSDSFIEDAVETEKRLHACVYSILRREPRKFA
jgi:hypothetical protein